jgi:hypothetical protein
MLGPPLHSGPQLPIDRSRENGRQGGRGAQGDKRQRSEEFAAATANSTGRPEDWSTGVKEVGEREGRGARGEQQDCRSRGRRGRERARIAQGSPRAGRQRNKRALRIRERGESKRRETKQQEKIGPRYSGTPTGHVNKVRKVMEQVDGGIKQGDGGDEGGCRGGKVKTGWWRIR